MVVGEGQGPERKAPTLTASSGQGRRRLASSDPARDRETSTLQDDDGRAVDLSDELLSRREFLARHQVEKFERRKASWIRTSEPTR